MHVLFIHKIFPAQFGHVARRLVQREGFQCTYVCERLPATVADVGPVQYSPDFASGTQIGSRAQVAAPGQAFQFSMFAPPSQPQPVPTPDERICEGIRLLEYGPLDDNPGFDSLVARGHTVYQLLKRHPEIRPDLVVGSSIYASSTFLPDLYECPVINYFDYYYQRRDSYVDFRPEFPPDELDVVRARAHNALVLLDLQACAAGYSPTAWQRDLFPAEYRHKIATIFDGVDREFWYRREVPRRIGNRTIPANVRIVTYVARGLEAMRGFDIFMRMAKQIAEARSDVVFVVVGSENFYHGQDLKYIRARSFLQHVLQQDQYDVNRFVFAGRVSSSQLVEILSLSDLHVYLTAPFVLSWSLFDALACGCVVLASDTAPVREVIQHEQTGLLAGFFDVEGLTRQALRVLDDPHQFRHLGQSGVELIDARYSLARTVPDMIALYRRIGKAASTRDKDWEFPSITL
jgi:glycosyltransferase involved in cell wall biosynthesis